METVLWGQRVKAGSSTVNKRTTLWGMLTVAGGMLHMCQDRRYMGNLSALHLVVL